jgi:hypothetical protein
LNIGVGLVIFLIGIVILGVITGIYYRYLPSNPCPTEEDCSEAWDEYKAASTIDRTDALRVFHNCRMRHRINDPKPDATLNQFKPTCETHCAFIKREEENPQLASNPLEGLICLDLL